VTSVSYIGRPFAHDLFITYSHGSIDSGDEAPLKRWSEGFIRELELELRAHPKFGRELSLFFDDHHRPGHGLDPNAGLTEQLRADIGGAALLQVLMSDHYLKSKWCTDERDWWQQRQAELGLVPDERISIARIWPTSEPWPALFADERGIPFVGFCFYDPARAEVRPQPYEWPAPDRTSKGPFRDQLLELVGWLWQKVELLKKRMEERVKAEQDVAKLAQDTGQVLYLHGRVEHQNAWRMANAALRERGFAVLPGAPEAVTADPVQAQHIRQRRVQTLADCDALLLLATDDGAAVDADLVVVGRRDRQSARAFNNRSLPCGLLDTAGSSIATPERRQAARALQVDWLDGTREPWAAEVQSWLTEKSAAAARSI
jgi:hypothetical protein